MNIIIFKVNHNINLPLWQEAESWYAIFRRICVCYLLLQLSVSYHCWHGRALGIASSYHTLEIWVFFQFLKSCFVAILAS